MRKIGMVIGTGIAVLALSAANTAFGRQFDVDSANFRHEDTAASDTDDAQRHAGIRLINGALSCDRGAQNTGTACLLQVKDGKTGQTYAIAEAGAHRDAMRLYNEGLKNVILEAKLTGSGDDTLEITSARANN